MIRRLIQALIRSVGRISGCLSICMHDIVTTIEGYCYDKKLDINTSVNYGYSAKDEHKLYSDAASQGRGGDALTYGPTEYSKIRKMINYLKLDKDNDVFVDLGCGEGRVIFLVATQKLKKVIGVDLNKAFIATAIKNLNTLKFNNTPIEFLNRNAVDFDFTQGTIFYMFNPFGSKTLTDVIANIKESQVINPRRVRILYFNAVYRGLLDSIDWLLPEGEIDNTGIFVWHNK